MNNLLTVCTDCHTYHNHQPGGELYELKTKAYQKKLNLASATQMNNIKSSIVRKYEDDKNVSFTWGYVTNLHRRGLRLSKSHTNDAVAITGVREIKAIPNTYILLNSTARRSVHSMRLNLVREEKNLTESKSEMPRTHPL